MGFGLAVSPLDEDREAIAFDMERAGYGPEIKAKATEVADATATIVASNFTHGYEQLETVKRKYGQERWFKSVRGNVTAYPLATSTETSRKEGPSLLEGVPAQYDPLPVLANLEVPQLWILGGQDRDAPPGETLRRLAALRESGRPITTVVFPGADHGMYEFETLPNGERVSTRQPEGYFALMRDFIKGRAGQRQAGDPTVRFGPGDVAFHVRACENGRANLQRHETGKARINEPFSSSVRSNAVRQDAGSSATGCNREPRSPFPFPRPSSLDN